MSDYEAQFLEHVDAIERICEECASDHPDLADHIRECVDAARPKLDNIQDDLSQASGGSAEESKSDE